MQIAYVYLNWFQRNSLLNSVSQPKISIKPLFKRSRSSKVIEIGALSRTVTEIQRLIGQKSQILPTPLSFSALVRGDPLRIYGKALRFLKLESSGQPTMKIW